MKNLQNNFTTPDQSKRLLELGLPVKSADCYYCIINATIQQGIEVICDSDIFFDMNAYLKDFFPCWSVGRLIEIMIRCDNSYTGNEELRINRVNIDDLISILITIIEIEIADKSINFSKLED